MPRARKTTFPPIPAKRDFSIGEASALCGVRPHVLLVWEERFPQLQSLKRHGRHRRYQQSDLALIRRIHKLLYEERLTIPGARQRLTAETASADHIAGELRAILDHLQS